MNEQQIVGTTSEPSAETKAILESAKRTMSLVRSEKFDKIAEALASAQGDIQPAFKDKVNPAFKSAYATFASVREACRIPLSSRKIALIQVLTDGPKGLRLVTELLLGDQWIRSEVTIQTSVNTDTKALQGLGSAESYIRRYVLLGLLGIATDDDDDGNGNGVGGNGPQNNGYGNNDRGNDRQQSAPQQPQQQRQQAPQTQANNTQGQGQAGSLPPAVKAAPTKAPDYPIELTGEVKDQFDALVNEAKACKTNAELSALAKRTKDEKLFPEGNPHAYLVYVIGRLAKRLVDAAQKAEAERVAAAKQTTTGATSAE